MKKIITIAAILCLSLFSICAIAWAGGSGSRVTGETYFDLATGHRYIKNSDSTYTEFSKRGKILRSDVPNSLPLLVSGRHMVELTSDHYLIYERKGAEGLTQRLLPADAPHPNGWTCKRMVSEILTSAPGRAEAYSSD